MIIHSPDWFFVNFSQLFFIIIINFISLIIEIVAAKYS